MFNAPLPDLISCKTNKLQITGNKTRQTREASRAHQRPVNAASYAANYELSYANSYATSCAAADAATYAAAYAATHAAIYLHNVLIKLRLH